jgi:hypothetical protein
MGGDEHPELIADVAGFFTCDYAAHRGGLPRGVVRG